MQINHSDYLSLVKAFSKNSRTAVNMVNAFWTGGLICLFGQALLDIISAQKYLTHDEAASAVTLILVLLSVLATGAGLYKPFAKIAGAGSLIPITGFANAVAAPCIEFRTEGFVTGVAVKLFTIAGPVIVYGELASFIYGVILWTIQAMS
ncbi:MAG: SpoVA/SpoVAEb family sporulation membrane protein [Clostridia bacterium]|nr:SpoVA/SpoVAEb family sporulation membrane protein [Clostridia bacterium]